MSIIDENFPPDSSKRVHVTARIAETDATRHAPTVELSQTMELAYSTLDHDRALAWAAQDLASIGVEPVSLEAQTR